MSICPKNKSSKARRDKRRANWKMSAPNLSLIHISIESARQMSTNIKMETENGGQLREDFLKEKRCRRDKNMGWSGSC